MKPELKELLSLSKDEQLVWVNTLTTQQTLEFLLELHELKERTRNYGRKYRTKQQMIVAAAKQFLTPDEMQALADRAQRKVDDGEE